MPRLIRRGVILDDAFTLVREATSLADLPEATPVIVPMKLWNASRAALVAHGDAGVWLSPGDDPAQIAADLAFIPVVAVDFPQFTDGRGYSTGRLLRERYGYAGELRAIGDIQRDQLFYLHQVGFDAFALREDCDLEGALTRLRDFTDGYQVTNLRTPWFRRRPAAEDRST